MTWGKLSISSEKDALHIGDLAIKMGYSGTFYREYGNNVHGEVTSIGEDSFTIRMGKRGPDGKVSYVKGHVSPNTVIGYEGRADSIKND